MNIANSSFEKALQENLALYLQTSEIEDSQNLFQVTREISIARFALSQQAASFFRAIEILNLLLDRVSDISLDQNSLTNVMTAIATIESKSQALVNTVQNVIKLVGEAAEIDIDKSALRTLVVNMPVLVKQTISRVSGDTSLADSVSLSLNNQITDLMTACRLDRETLLPATQSTNSAGINPQQFEQLWNTVPSQPVIERVS